MQATINRVELQGIVERDAAQANPRAPWRFVVVTTDRGAPNVSRRNRLATGHAERFRNSRWQLRSHCGSLGLQELGRGRRGSAKYGRCRGFRNYNHSPTVANAQKLLGT